MPAHDHDRRRLPWRALLAELLSTALLVWFGLAAAVQVTEHGPPPPLAHCAAAFGFVVIGNAMAFGPASGAHMNPAVTLAALLSGRASPARAAGYVAAQALGGVLGFGALLGTMPVPWAAGGSRRLHGQAPFGVTEPAAGVSPLAALAIEAAMTGLLALAWLALAEAERARPDPAGCIKLGLLIVGLIYVGGPATGASLNPARSLGPALWHLSWTAHWVYWVGPLGGAALAAALQRWVLAPPAPAPSAPARPEDVPLNDKP